LPGSGKSQSGRILTFRVPEGQYTILDGIFIGLRHAQNHATRSINRQRADSQALGKLGANTRVGPCESGFMRVGPISDGMFSCSCHWECLPVERQKAGPVSGSPETDYLHNFATGNRQTEKNGRGSIERA
jgi:hypothetical protein